MGRISFAKGRELGPACRFCEVAPAAQNPRSAGSIPPNSAGRPPTCGSVAAVALRDERWPADRCEPLGERKCMSCSIPTGRYPAHPLAGKVPLVAAGDRAGQMRRRRGAGRPRSSGASRVRSDQKIWRVGRTIISLIEQPSGCSNMNCAHRARSSGTKGARSRAARVSNAPGLAFIIGVSVIPG